MSSIKIVKAKLNPTKKGTGLIISFEETDDKGEKVTGPAETHSAIVQKEITDEFDRMKVHFAIMSGYLKAGEVEDIAAPDLALVESFTVKQFSIGGSVDDGTDGVTLSGSKILPNGKSHNFNTPFYRFNEGDASRYTFMDDLLACLNNLETEIIAYKKGEKRGQPVQPELPYEEEKVTKMKIVPPTEKATAEGNLAPADSQHKYANADAMQRIADDDKAEKKKTGRGKRVQQTAETPSGNVEETVQ